MPKSKPRAGAVAKAKRSNQRATRFQRPAPPAPQQLRVGPGHRHEYEFAVPPWVAWREIRGDNDSDETNLRILEQLPFHMHGGRCSALAGMASETGISVLELVEGLERLEAQGMARWDVRTQTIALHAPGPGSPPLLQLLPDPQPLARSLPDEVRGRL